MSVSIYGRDARYYGLATSVEQLIRAAIAAYKDNDQIMVRDGTECQLMDAPTFAGYVSTL